MTEPTTPLKALIVPNTGDLSGTWGSAALNPDFTAIDGMLGGVQTISLSSATTVTLSAPSGSITPGAGPNQSQNALLKFSGALTGNCNIRMVLPGFYIVENRCTGAFVVSLLPSAGTGSQIGLPVGQKMHVFYDGTNVDFVNLPLVGSYVDYAVTQVPSWVTACTVPPYLNCDGNTYSNVTYPGLFTVLGTTTLPDLRGRLRANLNQGTGRISASVNGSVLFAAGGADTITISQANLPNVSLPVTDPGHAHAAACQDSAAGTQNSPEGRYPGHQGSFSSSTNAFSSQADNFMSGDFIRNGTTGITVGTGGSGNAVSSIPPVQISGITLIRAG